MKNLLCLFLFFQMGTVSCQEKKWLATKIDTLQFQADSFIGFDTFGAYYYIKNNVLIKKNKTKTWQYKNLSLNKISKVDLQNPLNLVVFYENFNTVVLLDNQLNEIQKINFSENTIPILATATGLAFGNRLWIYNSLAQQIGLYDYLKSEFKTITVPFIGNIKPYDTNYNYFQWIDENQNWSRCNIFGKVTVLGKVPEFDLIQAISDSEIVYKKGDTLYYYTLNGNKTTIIHFNEKTFESFYYKDQILSIFTFKGITNYKITIP
ncbi:hypothetical protein [Flavobacterium psychrotolerans]|uniref:Uncharacterized protein n=1 Tax=Flavobacterium psychrotolerans TaxID=2169410 RepID=A0A2U1JN69_9FLAO|nr:hypothetical protein [Flavobacterium psychrotolerans]PWA06607.1 hypothetical protein DB895_03265 [Flavobacterium psychrotolerans]